MTGSTLNGQPAIGLSIAIGPSISFGLGGKIDDTFEYFGTDEVDNGNFKVAFGNMGKNCGGCHETFRIKK